MNKFAHFDFQRLAKNIKQTQKMYSREFYLYRMTSNNGFISFYMVIQFIVNKKFKVQCFSKQFQVLECVKNEIFNKNTISLEMCRRTKDVIVYH